MNTTPRRNRDLAAIHVAKKQLGLDDETYRDMLWTLARVRSAADLDEHGRRQVIEHLRARGFQDRAPRPRGRVAPDKARQVAKVRAMLAAAGRTDAYGDALAKRICHVDRVEWCDQTQLGKVIAALVYDARRRARGK